MENKDKQQRTANRIRNILSCTSWMKCLAPALLAGLLVMEGLLGYTAPDPFDGIEIAAQPVQAAEIPDLEMLEQTEAEQITPEGTGGKLAEVNENYKYKDGTYTGSARGFGGRITVRVKIADGSIVSIQIVSAPGETSSYLSRARAVIGRMLRKQSTNVDAVSGATYSSNGIILATRNALAKAREDGKSDDEADGGKKPEKPSKPKEPRKPEKPEVITDGDWNDGVYTGEGEGYSGKLTVQVTIEGGRITEIVLLETEDDEKFMKNAKKGIFAAVIDMQGTGVDAVTGATFSSYGLIEAINDALSKAEKENPGEQNEENEEPDSYITKTDWVICDEKEEFDDYRLTVTLAVKDGRIVLISDYFQDGSKGNDIYIKKAVNGINAQLNANGKDDAIDTVTGATCSSAAIRTMIEAE